MNVLDSKTADRHRVVNPRAAAIIAVTIVAFLFGMRKLHDRQFGKTVDFLRQSAYASLETKDYRKAQLQLNQYLTFHSSDLDAREKLSSLLSTQIRTRPALEQAFHLNEELLRNDLPQKELRLEQARIAVKLGKYSDAVVHLGILQALREESAEVWYLSGFCAKEARRTEEAVRCFQRALNCPNPPEQAFKELAMLAAANPHLMLDSETILDQMVLTCNSAEAWRLRAMQFIEARKFSQALPHVWKGLLAASDDVALNAILVLCLQSNDAPSEPDQTSPQRQTNANSADLPDAIRHLQGCVERNPQQMSFRVHLAALLWKNQQQVAAIEILETGISRNSRAFPLHAALLEYLLTQEQTEKAERLLRSLPAIALPRAERELLNGRVQLLRKEWKNADVSMQRAVAYSEPGSALQQRAQMLLAVCRSSSGDATTALDAFRTVVAGAPDSVPGRLGMASGWLKSGRKDLAIAEYRQLLEVPGVPAFLADLLIQRNLEQPAGLRDLSEVAELVRDGNPFITDLTQRTLLRTDLLMASGRITDAIAILESASTANPGNSTFQRALGKLNGEHSSELQNRLQQLAIDTPQNDDVLAALVRLDLGANRTEAALAILEDIATSQRNPKLNSTEALTLAIRTTERVIALETRFGRTQHTELCQDAARRYAYQLTKIHVAHEATLARILAQQGRTAEAMKRVQSIDATQDPAIKASALMAIAQYASPRRSFLPDVMRELVAMITAVPNSTALRICYADALLYDDHMETATQVLEQIQHAPPDDGEVSARLAWILAVESDSSQKAADLIAHAIQMQPGNPAFRVMQGRVLLAAGKYADALSTLNSIDEQHLSQAALTYKAATLLKMDKLGEAWRVVEQIRLHNVRDTMFPADELLLEMVLNRLKQFTTASRTWP